MQLQKLSTWSPDLCCLIATLLYWRHPQHLGFMLAICGFCVLCTAGEYVIQRAQHGNMHGKLASVILRGGFGSMRWLLALVAVLMALLVLTGKLVR